MRRIAMAEKGVSCSLICLIAYMGRWITVVACAFLSGQVLAQDSTLSVAGTYKGKQPCDECKEIQTVLELSYATDTTGEFSLRDKYVNPGGTNITSRRKGDWILRPDVVDGQKTWVVTLDYDNEEKITCYMLKASGDLVPLDENKHPLRADIDLTLKKEL